MADRPEVLKLYNKQKEQGHTPKDIEKQHALGKLTARERIDLLLDPASFYEFDPFLEAAPTRFGNDEIQTKQAVITGTGTINGRQVYLYSQDFTVEGGSLGEREAKKICKILDMATQNGKPFIGLNDSAGARIKEGIRNFSYWNLFNRNVLASGVIPQIFAIMGPCAGGAVYSPALGDFVFMVNKISGMFLTGPAIIKAVTSEEVSKEDLGGARIHNDISGVAHFMVQTEIECLEQIKSLLSYLPSNWREKPPRMQADDDINQSDPRFYELVPDNPKKLYDMHKVIDLIVDEGKFLEVQARFAKNIIVGFGRLAGHTIGIVANQPRFLGGCLDINASDKSSRFIRFCDAFNIPLLSLVDVPGYLPGKQQEYLGIIRHGAKMLYAYAEATVPKITLMVRKAYGGGIAGMCCVKERGADELFSWPKVEIASVGPEGAVDFFYGKEVKSAPDPEMRRDQLIEEFREKIANPYFVSAFGRIERIIDPKETRKELVRALLRNMDKKESLPQRKHGIIPV
jgi:acetyl-CoA carboxylase carboxyltransferase component